MFKINLESVKENVSKQESFNQENGFKNVQKSIPQQFCSMLESNSDLLNVGINEGVIRTFIQVLNFNNYFSNSIPSEIVETLDLGALLEWVEENRTTLKTTNDNMSIKERLKAWSDRPDKYLKSHIVGTTDKGSLNCSDKFRYKASLDNGLVTFSLKIEPENVETIEKVETKSEPKSKKK